MGRMRLGCQTITWDQERVEKRDHTVAAVAEAGYEGVEIGARFLDLTQPEEFKAVLDKNDVRLIALHTGWNPFLDGGTGDTGGIPQIIEFAQVTQAPFLVMSGNQREMQESMDDIGRLDEIGKACRQHGMTFCYHNHWWEVENNGRILSEIAARTDPDLVHFCPDIGWVRKTTPKVLDVLSLMESRIRMVHFKDYVADGLEPKDNETEFGQGIMDFAEAFSFLKGFAVDELWVIAEQWKSSVNHLPPEESIRLNLEFLRRYTAE